MAYEIGLYEKALPGNLSIYEKLCYAKEFGFDFIEMSIDESDSLLNRIFQGRNYKRNIINAMDASNFYFRSMCLSAHRKYALGSSENSIEQKSLDIMKAAIEFASDTGIRMIMLAGYDVYYEDSNEETKKRFYDNLQTCVDLAAANGVILGIETMEKPFIDMISKAMYFVLKIDSPYLQIYPDIGNITNSCRVYGADIKKEIYLGKGHIIAAHLKDSKPGIYRNLLLGEGCVDFPSAIRALTDIGVRRFVVEQWDQGKETWKTDLILTKKFIDSVFSSL